MRRGEAVLEQQPHRVAFVAECRLNADEDIAEMLAQHVDRCAVRLDTAGRRAPLLLDLRKPALVAHMLIGRHAGSHVGIGAEHRGVAVQDPFAQRVGV